MRWWLLPVLLAVPSCAQAPASSSTEEPTAAQSWPDPAVIATVNGEAIREPEVSRAVQGIDCGVDPCPKPQLALDAVIDNTLLRQEAERRGIIVANADVDRVIDNIVAGGTTREQLRRELEAQGLTWEQWRRGLRRDILVYRALLELVPAVPSDKEAEALMAARPEVIAKLREASNIRYRPAS